MNAASPLPAALGGHRPTAVRGRPALAGEAGRAVMLTALRVTVRTGLAGVWVRGRLPGGPVVWAANHHSWWDPFIAGELLASAGRRVVLLAHPANVRQYRFARRIGVIGTDELRSALAAVRGGAALVVYPEGRLLPPGPPGPLARGAAWSAARAPALLCSVAVRVLIRGGQYPEAYVVFGEVGADGSLQAVTERLHERLRQDLHDLDCLSTHTDPRQPLPGFACAVRGRRSWDQRIDAARGFLSWPQR
jgi:1-acyl-sn-glycerol-3-phosphate acyltransferase